MKTALILISFVSFSMSAKLYQRSPEEVPNQHQTQSQPLATLVHYPQFEHKSYEQVHKAKMMCCVAETNGNTQTTNAQPEHLHDELALNKNVALSDTILTVIHSILNSYDDVMHTQHSHSTVRQEKTRNCAPNDSSFRPSQQLLRDLIPPSKHNYDYDEPHHQSQSNYANSDSRGAKYYDCKYL